MSTSLPAASRPPRWRRRCRPVPGRPRPRSPPPEPEPCPISSPRAWHDEVSPMSRSLMPRMIALAVVIAVGVYYIAFDVMQYRIASPRFAVTVLMPSAGGLYTGADVTYRGVDVGTVTALDLNPRYVAVKLGIDPGQHIPDNGLVRVKELSALGEQYLDLQPSRATGPDLRSGTVIAADRVILPTPIGTTLVDLGSMLKNINTQALQTNE